MSIVLNSDAAPVDTSTAQGVKTANLVKAHKESEAQMAIELIASASIVTLPQPVGNSGHNINIKV
ncbi:MAG: cytoplasmic protein [Colwellia sp.]|nr:cytoplasmic protein [Colwellia sp.]MCW9080702.1 cytoplasmic protein [Colwellia sp.]